MAEKKKERKTKTGEVVKYLKRYGSITSWQAIQKFGATRLSDIVFRFRKVHGLSSIESKDITEKDRYGNSCTFTKYIYHKEFDLLEKKKHVL